MRKGKLITLISSAILNVVLLYYIFLKPENIDRTAYWHPFELNSNLNLKSIVKDGYKFKDMPCGQVQYVKQIADTIIQYEVKIDCKRYKGKYKPEIFTDEVKVDDISESNSNNAFKTREEEIAKNKYYPWKLNEIKDCYQKINWRVYSVNLGKNLDLKKVRNFIFKKGGDLIMEDWNNNTGGNAIAYYRENSIYFQVNISKDVFKNKGKTWVFKIIRTIPYLDFEQKQKNDEQQKKREKYYE